MCGWMCRGLRGQRICGNGFDDDTWTAFQRCLSSGLEYEVGIQTFGVNLKGCETVQGSAHKPSADTKMTLEANRDGRSTSKPQSHQKFKIGFYGIHITAPTELGIDFILQFISYGPSHPIHIDRSPVNTRLLSHKLLINA